jgi:hypothetical protein
MNLGSLCSSELEQIFIILAMALPRITEKIQIGAMEGGCSLIHSQGTESPSPRAAENTMQRAAEYAIWGKVEASPESEPW